MISLALMLVVLTVVGMVCRDASRVTNFAAVKEMAAGIELRMVEVGHECTEATTWESPTAVSTGAVNEIRFKKIDPEQNHDPPQATDRLPLPFPATLPSIPWNGFQASMLLTVRYYFDAGSNELVRDVGAVKSTVAPIRSDFQAQNLSDGRLRISYSFDAGDGKVVQRTQEVFLPLR